MQSVHAVKYADGAVLSKYSSTAVVSRSMHTVQTAGSCPQGLQSSCKRFANLQGGPIAFKISEPLPLAASDAVHEFAVVLVHYSICKVGNPNAASPALTFHNSCAHLLLLGFGALLYAIRSTWRPQHASTKRLFVPTAVEQQDSWDSELPNANLKCALCPRAALQSRDGTARLFISSSGYLILEHVADQTVLWSSGAQLQHAGAVAAAAAAAIGLFIQVLECV
jgi:hypothetical protein